MSRTQNVNSAKGESFRIDTTMYSAMKTTKGQSETPPREAYTVVARRVRRRISSRQALSQGRHIHCRSGVDADRVNPMIHGNLPALATGSPGIYLFRQRWKIPAFEVESQ